MFSSSEEPEQGRHPISIKASEISQQHERKKSSKRRQSRLFWWGFGHLQNSRRYDGTPTQEPDATAKTQVPAVLDAFDELVEDRRCGAERWIARP